MTEVSATMTDKEIGTAIKAGQLLKNADASQLSGACYELRLGNVYYDLTESDQPISVSQHGNALIKPGHRVVLITLEELEVPTNIVARIFSKGSLFSVGLSPTATYADPGFSGNLGIVTQNISDKYIILPAGETIAKIEFTRLSGVVKKAYTGQHGFQTEIWPIKHHLQKTYTELAKDPRIKSEFEEQHRLLPPIISQTIQRLHERQKWLVGIAILAITLNLFALYAVGTKTLELATAIIINLVSNTVFMVATWWTRPR